LVTLALCQSELENPVQAEATGQEALKLVDKLHLEAHRPFLYGALALAQGRMGQVEASIASARAGLAAAAQARTGQNPPNVAELTRAMGLADLLVQSAQPVQALAALEPVLQAAMQNEADLDRYGLRLRVGRALSLRGKILIEHGDLGAGLSDLAQAEQLMAKAPMSDGLKSQFLDRQAAGLIAQGRLGEAQCRLDDSRIRHQRLQHVGTGQFNEHVVSQVRLLMAGGRGDLAQTALTLFQPDAAFGGLRSRSAIEHDVLLAETLATQSLGPEARQRAQAVAQEIAARPQPQYVADLQARAAAVILAAASAKADKPAARPAMAHAAIGGSCTFDPARWLDLVPKATPPVR
jgi:hypothetical protein